MSIKGSAILLIACTAVASSASAEIAQQDGPSLPQFMSSAGRAELGRGFQETNSVSHDTRKAAEEISAKFAGVERAANGMDPETDSETDAHVAVLVTTDLSSAETSRTELKPTSAAPPSSVSTSAKQPAEKQVRRKHAQARTEKLSDASRPPMRFASKALPDADVGWRTGLIGMLTNPIFWR